ncbi:MAG: ABC transporter permease [Candidatus Leucobacter sulfamidivorax]|nr:ABC transporter permease [Candidatus Leucobacter sulfamidivorax]
MTQQQTSTEKGSGTATARPERGRSRGGFMKYSGIYIWIALIAIFGILVPQTFLTAQTATGIITNEAVTIIVAVGLLFSLSAGGFDLSIGQNLGFAAVLVATLSTVGGMDPFVSVVITLVLSTLVGVINGFFVSVIRIHSLIATLGMTSILLAATRLVSGQTFRGPVPDALRQMSNFSLFGVVPIIVLYALIIAFAGWYALEHTPFGRKLYATGANADAAFLAGVRTNRYLFLSFVITGFGSGLAGVFLAGKIGSVGPDIGPAYLLPAFAAAFLGTTQLKPGKFNVWGTVLAILLLATGVKGLQLLGGAQWITDAFNGVALLAAVSVAVVSVRRAARGRGRKRDV